MSNRVLAIICSFAVFVLVLVVGKLAVWTYAMTSPPDPERARFMIECTYDWSLSPQTCRQILDGDDPPVPPPEFDGC